MDIEGSIRKIGKETRPQDLSDLMVGERILLRGVRTDTQEEEGVVVWTYPLFRPNHRSFSADRRFLVALRSDIEERSDRNSNRINLQLYINSFSERTSFTKLGIGGADIERGRDTEFTKYNQLLENAGL